MSVEEIEKYVNTNVALVIPIHRRTTMATWGVLTSDVDNLTGEKMFSVSGVDEVFRFPANDVHAIEISVKHGTVVRLTS